MTAPPALAKALDGRYRIERELGRGGMATVYLADDRKHDRPVAVKVLHPELAASLGSERFLREIRIAARLAHPYILPLIDSGNAGGFLYYVTPHVPDGSLRQRLATGPLQLEQALSIVREVGSGLDYANRQGFIHRDVKPDNILFTDGHAVLADFGIARAVGQAGRGDAVTEVGLGIGTPEYMSPEQAAGEEVDASSDAYSLAIVVYEMLAGEPPLRGTGARATIAKQMVETPRPLRALRPEAPPHVERALARALAKNPAERFATVADLVTALQQDAGGAPPVVSGMAQTVAVLPFVATSAGTDTEYLADGLTDELIDAFAKIDGLRVASRSSVFALKGKPADVRAIGAMLGATFVIEGSVRVAGNRLRVTAQLASTEDGRLLWSQRFDRTLEDVFAIQEEIARTIVDTLRATSIAGLGAPALRRHTTNLDAYQLYLKGRYLWNKRTQAGVAEAIEVFKQAIAADPRYAQAYAGLSDAYALSLDYRSVPVAEGFAHAKEYALRAIALDETVAEAHSSLAWALFINEWNWAEAGREFRRAIELDPSYASAHQWYGFLLVALGNITDAVAEVHRAHELDPVSISIRRSVGFMYYYARRFDQAVYWLERAAAQDPGQDETHRVLGLTYAMQERWAEAEQQMRTAVSLQPAGTYSPAMLAYVLARTGRTDEARAVQRDIEARARTDYVSPVAFATMHLGFGEWDQAFDQMDRARAERRGWMAYLRVNPIVDPLRDHPRFAVQLAAMKL